MNPALQKTIALLLLIGVGFLLKSKVNNRDQLGGIKLLILSIALPATIFIALLKIEINLQLMTLPLLAIGFNIALFSASWVILNSSGINSKQLRTLAMLLPSLAPGLSCFPFLAEYVGENAVAWAALADVGNKVFVLIILYLVAMSWYRKNQLVKQEVSTSDKIKGLLLSLVKEPVNMVLLAGLTLLVLGYSFTTLPQFIQQVFGKMSAMMTPMVLIFIGLAVKLKLSDVKVVVPLLLFRSGFSFCLSALFLTLVPDLTLPVMILAVVFPQSSTSFWPFAHMTAVSTLERADNNKKETFDMDLGLTIMAFSLPFSSILIMGITATGSLLINPVILTIIGVAFLVAGFVMNKLFSGSLSRAVVNKQVSA